MKRFLTTDEMSLIFLRDLDPLSGRSLAPPGGSFLSQGALTSQVNFCSLLFPGRQVRVCPGCSVGHHQKAQTKHCFQAGNKGLGRENIRTYSFQILFVHDYETNWQTTGGGDPCSWKVKDRADYTFRGFHLSLPRHTKPDGNQLLKYFINYAHLAAAERSNEQLNNHRPLKNKSHLRGSRFHLSNVYGK